MFFNEKEGGLTTNQAQTAIENKEEQSCRTAECSAQEVMDPQKSQVAEDVLKIVEKKTNEDGCAEENNNFKTKTYVDIKNCVDVSAAINKEAGNEKASIIESSDKQANQSATGEIVSEHVQNGVLEEVAAQPAALVTQHEGVLDALLQQLKPIDFYKRAGLKDGEKIQKKHFCILTVEELMAKASENNWGLCVYQETVYCYNSKYWKPLSEGELKAFLGKAALKMGVEEFDAKYHKFQEDLVNQFFVHAKMPNPIKQEGEVQVNLRNGTFKIAADRQGLYPYAGSDFLTYELPFDYIPGQSAPLFERYLQKVLPDESCRKVLQEFLGYLFVDRKVLKLEKALILFGDGANGKSVFFDIITALLGFENVSSFSLQSLTDAGGGYRAQIKDKLCNYASEISSRMNASFFKQMVSQEPVEARHLYGRPFVMDKYAKFIFNTNELPRDVEHKEAYFRRFIILRFDVTIPERERDPQLSSKIINSELPGVFNWVLAGLQRLLEQKGFTDSVAVNNAIAQYKIESDSVQMFLSDHHYIKSISRRMPAMQLFSTYKDYCRNANERMVTQKEFNRRLRTLGYTFGRQGSGMVVFAEQIVLE